MMKPQTTVPPTETVDQVRLNMTRCGECGGPMMAVGPKLAFCIRGSCSMCGRGVDDKPLPRRVEAK